MNTRIAPWKRKPRKQVPAKPEKVVYKPGYVLLAIPTKGQTCERVEIGRKAFCDVFPQLKDFKIEKLHALFTQGRDMGLYKDWCIGSTEEVGGTKLYKINLKY